MLMLIRRRMAKRKVSEVHYHLASETRGRTINSSFKAEKDTSWKPTSWTRTFGQTSLGRRQLYDPNTKLEEILTAGGTVHQIFDHVHVAKVLKTHL